MMAAAKDLTTDPARSPVDDSAIGHFVREHRARAAGLPGASHPWVSALRQAAIDRFQELGFPGPRNEHWKYTRVSGITRRGYRLAAAAADRAGEAELAPFLLDGLECHRLVFVNGWYAPHLSRVGKLPEGVVLGSLAQVLGESPGLVQPWLTPGEYHSGFEALNAAFVSDGAWLYLPRGAVLEKPVHLVYLSKPRDDPSISHPRTLIVAGATSQAQVVESYVSAGESHLSNAVTTVVLDEGAVLEHYKLQEESVRAVHIGRLDVREGRGSRFTSHAVSLGAELSRNDIVTVLEAEGAECALNGLYMVDGRQHVDFHTSVEHREARGTSREYYKGILGGRSRGVFNGRVHVHPGAQRTDSEQANRNLLLSRDAEVDTKPELEIYADDVKCSHGATVGQLDPDMLFYLRARGIDEDAARGLLTYGFAQDVIERMGVAAVRSRLERMILSRVPDAEQVRAMV